MTSPDDRTGINDLLPLTRLDFLILLVLTEEECHGYGIVKEIEERTEGMVQLLPGNLYAVMNRLMRNGLVVRAPGGSRKRSEDKRRRYFRITPLGRKVLAAEASAMRSLVQEATVRNLMETEAGG